MQIFSYLPFGYEGELIKVEADLRRGIPAIDIVGLPDGAVREARERVRAAIRNSGIEFPRDRILINLSPANVKKEGSGFDLPMALALLSSAGMTAHGRDTTSGVLVLGELELSGTVRPVTGVLAAVERASRLGIRCCIVPEANRREAAALGGTRVLGVHSLREAVSSLGDLALNTPLETPAPPVVSTQYTTHKPVWTPVSTEDYRDVRGQNRLLRALQIAAAGGHNILVYGPPGCGKTLALRRFHSLLPDLDRRTAMTVSRIHSIAGLLENTDDPGVLVKRPPFREPHQGASLEGIIGGGRLCRPGEISLAHGGVLFLDETGQFRSSVLQSLRVPLETGTVTLSRAGRTATFPAAFQLLLATNPCPCGNQGSPEKTCTCDPESIERYWRRFGTPLLDRIEIRIPVQPPNASALAAEEGLSTADLRSGIASARAIQMKRCPERLNGRLNARETALWCRTQDTGTRLLEKAAKMTGLSGRGTHAVLRVARTIADMEESGEIREEHILEGLQLRCSKDGLHL